MATFAVFGSPVPGADFEFGFDNAHKVIGTFVEALQSCFKYDTHYDRPLIQPQANIVFCLDDDVARKMTTYMCTKIQEVGFGSDEFRFSCKSGSNGEVVKRLRLEFPEGVSLQTIWKLTRATGILQQHLSHSPAY
jgi:hypothetical protein